MPKPPRTLHALLHAPRLCLLAQRGGGSGRRSKLLRHKRHLGLVAAAAALSTAACGETDPAGAQPNATGSPSVVTTIYPLHWVAQRLVASEATLTCLAGAGSDPLHFEPSRQQIADMQRAALIVLNGADCEAWAFTASLPVSRLVDTSHPFRRRFLRFENAVTHTHADGTTHSHTGIDPHTWVDPQNLAAQAEELLDALQRTLPNAGEALAQRMTALRTDLQALDAAFGQIRLGDGEVLVASHPAYGYAAARYGWRLVNLDLDPNAAPDESALRDLEQRLDGVTARVILWQSPPSQAWEQAARDRCALRSVVFSPCKTLPAPGDDDYLAAMHANLARLREALR